jgi:hypothetical protein
MVGLSATLDASADFDAIHARHHDIQQHYIGLYSLDRFKRIDSIHSSVDFKILRRELRFEKPDVR